MPSIGNDLASIRKELQMSVEDVHLATKIPLHIIKTIEDESIFEDFEENTTYKRSYIRSYAKALDLSDRLVVRALDQAEKGTYSGLLREADGRDEKDLLLHAEPESDTEPGEEAEAEPPDETQDMVHDHAPTRETSAAEEARAAEPEKAPPTPPSVSSIDWADMGKRFIPLQRSSRLGVALIIALIAIAGIAAFIYMQGYFNSSQDTSGVETTPETTPAIESDSLQLNLTTPATEESSPSARNNQRVTLSDTLELVIYAAYDKLEPVRVYTDVIGSLNPYWIEQGQAYKFEFVNTARIRGQYSRMVLMLNGHAIENFRQQFLDPESGMIELSRSIFEGDQKWLQPPPDSLDIDAPPPQQIRNRPIYN